MNLFRDDAHLQLALMGRARANAGDARKAGNTKRFCAAVGEFSIALQAFAASMHLAEVLR